jgi:hypothetical protein
LCSLLTSQEVGSLDSERISETAPILWRDTSICSVEDEIRLLTLAMNSAVGTESENVEKPRVAYFPASYTDNGSGSMARTLGCVIP